MITACPSCQRQFRIYAKQLTAAGGRVQCGFCGMQFNALDRLYDKPLPASADGSIVEEPQFDIPEVTDSELAGPAISALPEETSSEIPAPVEAPEAYFADELALPEPPPRRSRLSRVLWSLGVLALLLGFAAQLAWFNRDFLLARYPDYAPLVKQLCERYSCELVRERDIDAIVLVNRDVRDHPRYANALLVNITIENRSDKTQPYPGIQFTLIDGNGATTGVRRLQPSEYLEAGEPIDAGMPPHVPLHLVLEVAETTQKPVGFEFGFFYP